MNMEANENRCLCDHDGIVLSHGLHRSTPPYRWIATLSGNVGVGGRTNVIMQDDLPNLRNSWLRLKDFVEGNDEVGILDLCFQTPDFIFSLPSNQAGYYHMNRPEIAMGSPMVEWLLVGYQPVSGGHVHVFNWTPMASKMTVIEQGKAGFGHIRNR